MQSGIIEVAPVARHVSTLQVVREGRPCHLYFDLECPAPCNPNLDMDSCINCLLHHVDEALGWVEGPAAFSAPWSLRVCWVAMCRACLQLP